MNLQTHIRDEETEVGLMYMKKLLKRAGMFFYWYFFSHTMHNS